ncbi:heterokaryon incompatibility protein-domain-containing protein [Podospora didyma]|uniref:Heterokaryon incompatibility protein-domain-containing protein n=1 Tax=Podospora didyma TaxID=330526 RepID=A0AAE0N2R4_9PEZI|nr:heterokaryon incompatibility protein-domain-containing protein [Podospora didyma]
MSALCERCQSFDIQSFATDVAFSRRGYHVSDVLDSAKNGCMFCTALVEAFPVKFRALSKKPPSKSKWRASPVDWIHFRAFNYNNLGPVLSDHASTESFLLETAKGLDIEELQAECIAHAKGEGRGGYVRFHTAADPTDPAAVSGDIVGHYTGRRTAPSEEFATSIKRWLATCRANHSRCLRTLSGCEKIDSQNSPLPTRCIHVSKSMSNDGSLEVCLTDTAGGHGTYMTVSHRWTADTDKTSTTRTNLTDRLQGRRFDALPRLFTDAFILAAQLEIPYVWIDSLCIIQGEDDEWNIEALKMADYYQRSVFTVACPSAGSDGSHSGLFNGVTTPPEDDPSSRAPLIRLPYRDKTGQQQGHFYLFRTEAGLGRRFKNNITESDLLSRGWVFQEWMLSRRIVCYTPSGLFFLCEEEEPQTQMGETVFIPSALRTSFDYAHVDFSLKNTAALPDDGNPVDIYRAWKAVVEAYSRLHLTKPSQDRLVALSGIVNEFTHALETRVQNEPPGFDDDKQWGSNKLARSTYVAGLWLAGIRTTGLLWEQVGKGTHTRIDTLPTWSWASICTPVMWANNFRWDNDYHTNNNPPVSDLGETIEVVSLAFAAGLSSSSNSFPTDNRNNTNTSTNNKTNTSTNNKTNTRTNRNGKTSQGTPLPAIIITDPNQQSAAAFSPSPITTAATATAGGTLPPITRFPVLCLHAKLQPVIIGGFFGLPMDEMAVLMNVVSRSPTIGLDNWRTVASPRDREHIAGWASIEHPDFQINASNRNGGDGRGGGSPPREVVYALHVSTAKGVNGGFNLGYTSFTHHVYNVLFVRRVSVVRDGYERVGVGRIFGKDMDRGLGEATMREIRLV